jgi:hypothetical protein
MKDRLIFIDEAAQINGGQKEYRYRIFEISDGGIKSDDLNFDQTDGQRVMTRSLTANVSKYMLVSYDSMQKSPVMKKNISAFGCITTA